MSKYYKRGSRNPRLADPKASVCDQAVGLAVYKRGGKEKLALVIRRHWSLRHTSWDYIYVVSDYEEYYRDEPYRPRFKEICDFEDWSQIDAFKRIPREVWRSKFERHCDISDLDLWELVRCSTMWQTGEFEYDIDRILHTPTL